MRKIIVRNTPVILIAMLVILAGWGLGNGTLRAEKKVTTLPEFVVKSNGEMLLHVLAYVREYSTMSTYTDTIFLFREKMVDFMLPSKKSKSKLGWSLPRILRSDSYYRFTDCYGLDSVSATCRHHFSWSDWIGIPALKPVPKSLAKVTSGVDTIRCRKAPAEIWQKSNDRIDLKLHLLSDSVRHNWLPEFANVFNDRVEFYSFDVDYTYENVLKSYISPTDLSFFSFNIESNGRGRDMFRFNHRNQPVFISSRTEVYVLDREYISGGEAKKWCKRNFLLEDLPMLESPDAPKLGNEILSLMKRVENIDTTQVRIDSEVDHRIGYQSGVNNYELGRRLINTFKDFVGITAYKSRKNAKNNWRRFQSEVRHMNDSIARIQAEIKDTSRNKARSAQLREDRR